MSDIYAHKPQVEAILNQVTVDNIELFNPTSDSLPLNYTINCFFDPQDFQTISTFIDQLKLIDPDQFYYSPQLLHITLLGEIDINSDINKLISTTQIFLDKYPLNFHLLGIGGNKKVTSITAYPSFPIQDLRSLLRDIGGGSNFHGPYEHFTWINFLRYPQKPNPELLTTLKRSTNLDFGTIKPKKVQLLKNSSRTLKGAQVIHSFT